MKKFLIAFFVLLAGAGRAFAEIEFSPRIFGDFLLTSYDDPIYEEKLFISDFGAEAQASVWFAHAGFFDMGLCAGIDAGAGAFKSDYKGNPDFIQGEGTAEAASEKSYAQFTFGIGLAPIVQINLSGRHSFYLAPGLRLALAKIRIDDDEEGSTLSYTIPEFSLEAGYKFWISETFALTAGYKYELPLSLLNGGNKIDYDSAQAHRIFAGISWKPEK